MQRFPTLTSNSAERPASKIAVIRGRKNTWSDTYSSNQLIIEQKYRKNRQYIYIYMRRKLFGLLRRLLLITHHAYHTMTVSIKLQSKEQL